MTSTSGACSVSMLRHDSQNAGNDDARSIADIGIQVAILAALGTASERTLTLFRAWPEIGCCDETQVTLTQRIRNQESMRRAPCR